MTDEHQPTAAEIADTAEITGTETLGDDALSSVAGGTIFRKGNGPAVVVPTPDQATDMYIRRHTK